MSVRVVNVSGKNPGCLVQLLWFLLVGWWAGELWIVVAWLLMLTVVGIPLAVKMMNKIPQVIALRGQADSVTITTAGDGSVVSVGTSVPQHNIVLRSIYFLLIGWWLSGVWMEAAYVICATIIGLPVGFWMFDKVPAIVSLRR